MITRKVVVGAEAFVRGFGGVYAVGSPVGDWGGAALPVVDALAGTPLLPGWVPTTQTRPTRPSISPQFVSWTCPNTQIDYGLGVMCFNMCSAENGLFSRAEYVLGIGPGGILRSLGRRAGLLGMALRRSTRDHYPSTRYSAHEYVLLTNGGEPECYAEAIEDEHKKEWFETMEDEMNSLHENNTFYQKRGIDFDEIFSPVVKMGSIRVVLGLAASLDLEVEQMDVKTAFLHGDLDKEIYMEQPEAPRQWYKKFESVIGKQGYRKTSSDHCVFFQKFGDDDFIILLLYVDDMLIVGKNIGRIAQLKRDLSKSFSMKDLGPAKQIIGIRIFRDRGAKKLHISQEQYIEKVLCRFNMDKAKVVSSPLTTNFKLTDKDCPSSKKNIEKMDRVPYASAVGSLMYAMVCTRPDLAHAVGVVSRFLSNPGKKHWEAVKWIFRYLRGTSKLGITFGNGKPMLVGFTDSDMAGNKDNMKSTSGYLMTFAGGAVSWQSRLQKCVALSTTEAEYMAATEACKELLWLKRFLQELGFKQQRYAVLCDNQSAIHLAKNSMFHKRTKHIDIRYHWIRDAIEDGMFELNKVHTDDNASDMLTKAVAREKLKVCCSIAGMANSSS
ncbi:putative RNA-directed DNA polymerase [Tanacetum coccineum]